MKVSATEEEYEFSNDIFGGSISSSYMSAIDKGVKSVMKDGVIVETGASDKIFSHPEHDYTKQLIATAFQGQ